jgi:hypothetical protein
VSTAPWPPERALLYHFTHVDNLSAILGSKRLVADSVARESGLVTDVGDRDVKASRRARAVPIPPGGVVADYVPFYFAPQSPMMFRIACDHRDAVTGRYPGGDDPLVYLMTSVDLLGPLGAAWIATDGNAASSVTEFTSASAALRDMIDWPLMEATYWHNIPEDPDRQRRRMAELLVHREFPIELIRGIATRTPSRERDVRRVLTTHGLGDLYVGVRPAWYYGYERRR